MTISQWSNNEAMRAELAQLISHPTMQAAITTLRLQNLPSLKLGKDIQLPGMDPMHCIALESAKRAGGQNILTRLMEMPLLGHVMADAFSDPALFDEPSPQPIAAAKPRTK